MKIGVISDTHGSAGNFSVACENLFGEVDLILHVGDLLYHGPRNPQPEGYDPAALAELINKAPVPIIICKGNCDSEVDGMVIDTPIEAPYAHLFADGCRIVMTHGQNVPQEDEKISMAKKMRANIFITGHTHVSVLKKVDGVILLNPGSPSLSKRSDGRQTAAIIGEDCIEIKDIFSAQTLQSHSR